MNRKRFFRMASWWLRSEILEYPSQRIHDQISIRADNFAESGCDSAIMFGAHFRWDYMPEWTRLHAYIHEVAEALHARGLVFFDHFSSVLTARPSHGPNLSASSFSRKHVFLSEINADAENWTFDGHRLNDWRMLSVETGKPVFLTQYAAEEFCINNPDFQKASLEYLKKLLPETGIDGLMWDDAFFYPGLTACACRFCREKFGQKLPPVSCLDFWGNWNDRRFLDWIAFRYRSVAEFNALARSVLPHDFPLMNCCSGSVSIGSNANALSAGEFMRASNMLMLEMCGNTPRLDGVYTQSIAAQLHHLSLAGKYDAPCIGLGYAHRAAPAEFIWAFNKFLGSGTWISTLKQRLGLPEKLWDESLPDEPALIRRAFRFEKAHPDLFSGERRPANILYFSRSSRDNYGGRNVDYARDYYAAADSMMNSGIDFDVMTSVPHPASVVENLYLPSAACLSDDEIRDLEIFLRGGGKIYASGPCGVFDSRGVRRSFPWIRELILPDLDRKGAYPVNLWEDAFPVECANQPGWREVAENLFWNPLRMQNGCVFENTGAALVNGFFHRRFYLENGSCAEHYLSAALAVELDEALEKQRSGPYLGNNIISSLRCMRSPGEFTLEAGTGVKSAKVICPLSDAPDVKIIRSGSKARFTLPDGCYYFIFIVPSIKN